MNITENAYWLNVPIELATKLAILDAHFKILDAAEVSGKPPMTVLREYLPPLLFAQLFEGQDAFAAGRLAGIAEASRALADLTDRESQ